MWVITRYGLSRDQRRTLHDRITGQNYTPEEIDAEAKDIANTEKPERPRNRGQ